MRILIAEDDRVSGKLLQRQVESLGHETVWAEDGAAAWARFEEDPFPMVLTDWVMPEMDGLALCEQIRSAGGDHYTYLIIITAAERRKDFVQALDAGADDFIVKPFDPDEIRVRIQTGERIVRLEGSHKDLQETLRESRNKLRVVFDALNDEVVSVDEALRVVSANAAFLRDKGSHFRDIIGQDLFLEALWPGSEETRIRLREKAEEAFSTGSVHSDKDHHVNEQGEERDWDIRMLPILDQGNRPIQLAVVFKDTTDIQKKSREVAALNRKLHKAFQQIKVKNEELTRTLKHLEDTQAQILQSEKMASVGQLAAGVAHEVNNPTGFVSSNLKTLAEYQEDVRKVLDQYRELARRLKDRGLADEREDLEGRLARIRDLETELDMEFILDDATSLIQESREGAERIKKIVMDLKDFAHPGEDRIVEADINQGLDSTLNVVWNELKYKAEVHRAYAPLPPVPCLPQQLNQVFMNLFVNAAQAMETKGDIYVTTSEDNGRAVITIRDTGLGIPREHLSQVFDPFFTTKDVGKGTGLGLNIAYNIIQKHRGTIEVESEEGKGTTFTISLPLEGLKEAPPAQAAEKGGVAA